MPYVTHKLRRRLSDLRTKYENCHCGHRFRGNADYLAHGAKHYYWADKAGKAMRRKMGKTADSLRRSARSNLERHRYVDEKGRRTWQWRTRPDVLTGPGRVSRRLRDAQRHQNDFDRAAYHKGRASALDGRAGRHKSRAASRRGPASNWSRWRSDRNATRAATHQAKAAAREGRWAENPSRAAPPPRAATPKTRSAPSARPAPARPAPAAPSAGRPAPAPARIPPAARPARGARPAPGSDGNGHRPAPERTGRTR
jgi:hypothetical protein